MRYSKRIFAAVAVFGVAVSMGSLIAAPFNASARAAGQADVEVVAERIGGAFASAGASHADPAIRAAAVRASKGDLPGCVGQTWPDIAPGCLLTSDGSPAPEVRFVTVGQPAGEAVTVLMRVPASDVAER
jgi:hypothetical protein